MVHGFIGLWLMVYGLWFMVWDKNKTSCTFLFHVEQHLNLESSTADEEFKCTVESAEDNTGLPYNDISSLKNKTKTNNYKNTRAFQILK